MFDRIVFTTVSPHSAGGFHMMVGSAHAWEGEPVVAAIAASVTAHRVLYSCEEGRFE